MIPNELADGHVAPAAAPAETEKAKQKEVANAEKVAKYILGQMQKDTFLWRFQYHGVKVMAVTGPIEPQVLQMNGIFNFKRNAVYHYDAKNERMILIGKRKKDHFLRIIEPKDSQTVEELERELKQTYRNRQWEKDASQSRIVTRLETKQVQLQAFIDSQYLFTFRDSHENLEGVVNIDEDLLGSKYCWEPYPVDQGFVATVKKERRAFDVLREAASSPQKEERVEIIKNVLLDCHLNVSFLSIPIESETYKTPQINWVVAPNVPRQSLEKKFLTVFPSADSIAENTLTQALKDLNLVDKQEKAIASLEDVWPTQLGGGTLEAFIRDYAESVKEIGATRTANAFKTEVATLHTEIVEVFGKSIRPAERIVVSSAKEKESIKHLMARYLKAAVRWETQVDEEMQSIEEQKAIRKMARRAAKKERRGRERKMLETVPAEKYEDAGEGEDEDEDEDEE